MASIFSQNLPPQLSAQIHEQYSALLPIFRAYGDRDSNSHYSEISNNYEVSFFILELAIFYKTVVIPLREASYSLRDFQSLDGIREIQIGKYIFSSKDSRKIQSMCADLLGILLKYHISENLLLFSDIKEFGRNLNSYLRNRNA